MTLLENQAWPGLVNLNIARRLAAVVVESRWQNEVKRFVPASMFTRINWV